MKNFKIIYALAFLVFVSCSSSDDDEVASGEMKTTRLQKPFLKGFKEMPTNKLKDKLKDKVIVTVVKTKSTTTYLQKVMFKSLEKSLMELASKTIKITLTIV
jgi:hypothetical protein